MSTLSRSFMVVETIKEADVVFIYDYCLIMWALANLNAAEHWWTRNRYIPNFTLGTDLMNAYM